MITDLINYLRLGGFDFPYVGITANSYLPIPSGDDYKNGYIERFFVKRVNNSIIIETNRDEFYNLPTDLYLKVQIKWVISGKDKSNISKQNLMSAKFIEKYFSTKTALLKDSLQFFKN